MPQTTGAIRKMRADKRKSAVNLAIRTGFKAAVSTMRKKPTEKNLVSVYSKVDRAVKRGVIHKNKGARLKSRLIKLLRKKRT